MSLILFNLAENNIKPLEIPAQSYKIMLDRMNNLEAENIGLIKLVKARDSMIVQKDQQIQELQTIIEVFKRN